MDATWFRRFLLAVGLVGVTALAAGQTGCATTDTSGTSGDTDASTDSVAACGAVDTPCCEPTGACNPGLFCNQSICKPQQVTDLGKPCKVDSDCQSGLCGYVQFPPSADSDGGNEFPEGGGPPATSVCTTGCTADSQCMAGWQCTELSVGQGTCTCTAILELCNGKDDNCNGIVDDEPWADEDCSNNAGVPEVCKGGLCGCVNECEGSCVDLQNDSTNCGTCGTNCDANLQICQKGACVCGNAAGTVKICGGQCVDTATDPKNCGSCGTACDFTCAASACGPTTEGSSSSIPGKSFTIDANNVYWIDESSTQGNVYGCAIGGCVKPTLITTTASTSPVNLAIAGGTLFWDDSSNGTIYSAPATACAADGGSCEKAIFTDANDSMQGLAVDGTDVYFVAENNSTFNNNLFKCAATGCTSPTNLIRGGGTIGFSSAGLFALDGTNLIWFDGTNLLMCPTAGCTAPTKIAKPANSVSDLAAGGGKIVFTDGFFGGVYSVPEAAKAAITTVFFTTGSNSPDGVATDGTNAYWSINASPPSGEIDKCPVDGCPGAPEAGAGDAGGGGTPQTLVQNLDSPTFIQIGPSALAWLQGSNTTSVVSFSK